jgi:bifunctional non-homologous end joining protein LigD
VLWVDGPVIDLPYERRRELLEELHVVGDAWCTAPAYAADPQPLLAACAEHGLEGVVAKRLGARYKPGERSRDWVKLKTEHWRAAHAPLRHDHR